MKKYLFIAAISLALLASGVWVYRALASATIVASYDIGDSTNGANYSQGVGQTFVTDADYTLDSVVFYLKKLNSPTGLKSAYLYATTGTCGVDAHPTGSSLATSDTFDISTLSTTFQSTTLTFSGANRVELTAGTCYAIVFISDTSDIYMLYDGTSPTDPGNQTHSFSGTWSGSSALDMPFIVYGVSNATPQTYVSSVITFD